MGLDLLISVLAREMLVVDTEVAEVLAPRTWEPLTELFSGMYPSAP